jgi:hypothetical protein
MCNPPVVRGGGAERSATSRRVASRSPPRRGQKKAPRCLRCDPKSKAQQKRPQGSDIFLASKEHIGVGVGPASAWHPIPSLLGSAAPSSPDIQRPPFRHATLHSTPAPPPPLRCAAATRGESRMRPLLWAAMAAAAAAAILAMLPPAAIAAGKPFWPSSLPGSVRLLCSSRRKPGPLQRPSVAIAAFGMWTWSAVCCRLRRLRARLPQQWKTAFSGGESTPAIRHFY